MSALDDRYAVVLQGENRFLARWLHPAEAAAYVESYNRIMRDQNRRAAMVLEPAIPPPPPAPLRVISS